MIVIDTEMSGIDPQKCCMLSLGAVDFENPSNTFYGECRLREGAEIREVSLRINGFTRESIAKAPFSEAELFESFVAWSNSVQDRTLAGHNLSLDVLHLRNAAKSAKIEWPFGFRIVDLHAIAYAHFLVKGNVPLVDGLSHLTLSGISQYTGIPAQPEPHNALMDAKMTAEAISRIVLGKSALDEFKKYPVPSALFK
ncbi:MAG: 3'-5' exonuclease [Candidatus Woesearchaeota archaeon]